MSDTFRPLQFAAVALDAAVLSPPPQDGEREKALREAASQFRFYEREHITKSNTFAGYGDAGRQVESLAKARANREFAEMCERALSASGQGGKT